MFDKLVNILAYLLNKLSNSDFRNERHGHSSLIHPKSIGNTAKSKSSERTTTLPDQNQNHKLYLDMLSTIRVVLLRAISVESMLWADDSMNINPILKKIPAWSTHFGVIYTNTKQLVELE